MTLRFTLIAFFFVLIGRTALADGTLDIPIRGFFYGSGKARIEIEIDPRCFLENPNDESPLLFRDFKNRDEAEKQKMIDDAVAFVPPRLKFIFESSQGVRKPKYDVNFTTIEGEPLEKLDDPVVIQLVWETVLPPTAKTFQIENKEAGGFNLTSQYQLNRKPVEEVHVILPGEKSDVLNLPERITEEEIRSVMVRPLIFGVGLLVAFIVLRSFRRFSK